MVCLQEECYSVMVSQCVIVYNELLWPIIKAYSEAKMQQQITKPSNRTRNINIASKSGKRRLFSWSERPRKAERWRMVSGRGK